MFERRPNCQSTCWPRLATFAYPLAARQHLQHSAG
jgi:hypothetical protein